MMKTTPPMKNYLSAALFLLPLFAFLIIFIVVPSIGSFVNSLTRDVGFLPVKFESFRNYAAVLSDPAFRQSVRFTLLFIVVSVPLELCLGLIFALVLDADVPFRGLLRACVLIPWAIPVTVSSRAWELIYNYNYGLANYLFMTLHLSSAPVNWLGTQYGAFIAVVIVDAWKTTPFVAVILLSGLQAIPAELYDQARIDRAGFLQAFRFITLPLLKPVIITAVLFRTIDALRVFDTVFVLTRGGPGGATTSVSLYAYKYFLSGDFGYGSAISIILFLIALVLAVFYVRIARFESEPL
jgi:multiple sugar transport system permease protein